MRRQARETVFKYIYSRLFNVDEGLFDVLASDLSQDDKNFATDLLAAVDKDFDKNLQVIQDYSIGFKLERVINVDKCAILIGLAELDAHLLWHLLRRIGGLVAYCYSGYEPHL